MIMLIAIGEGVNELLHQPQLLMQLIIHILIPVRILNPSQNPSQKFQ